MNNAEKQKQDELYELANEVYDLVYHDEWTKKLYMVIKRILSVEAAQERVAALSPHTVSSVTVITDSNDNRTKQVTERSENTEERAMRLAVVEGYIQGLEYMELAVSRYIRIAEENRK